MARDPQDEVPWYPTVDAETCIGCTLCYLSMLAQQGSGVAGTRFDRMSGGVNTWRCAL